MVAAVLSAGRLATDVLQLRSTIRIGITGLARAGKTALLTSLAANLLAVSAGRPALPAVSDRLRGRRLHVSIAPAAASNIPRFEVASYIAALAADPRRWPTRTTAVSMLALDVDVPREGLLAPLGPQRRRLEFLDYRRRWIGTIAIATAVIDGSAGAYHDPAEDHGSV
jgi:predicted YcjX-like family ATPase